MTSFDEFLITCPKADIDTMRAAKDGTLLARFVWDAAKSDSQEEERRWRAIVELQRVEIVALKDENIRLANMNRKLCLYGEPSQKVINELRKSREALRNALTEILSVTFHPEDQLIARIADSALCEDEL